MLSREGCILLYRNLRLWSSSDVIVMFKRCHHVKLHLSVLPYFKIKKNGDQAKWIHYLCECMIEKSAPRNHRLLSLGKPRDAKRWSAGRIFLCYPHTHDRFLYSAFRPILVPYNLIADNVHSMIIFGTHNFLERVLQEIIHVWDLMNYCINMVIIRSSLQS